MRQGQPPALMQERERELWNSKLDHICWFGHSEPSCKCPCRLRRMLIVWGFSRHCDSDAYSCAACAPAFCTSRLGLIGRASPPRQ